MKNRALFIFLTSLLMNPFVSHGQDAIKKNHLYIEGLGNNFYDENSNFSPVYFSLNYDRKIIKKTSFILTSGIGYRPQRFYYGNNSVTRSIMSMSAGVLWRHKYKRNGIWIGASTCIAFGKIQYKDSRQYIHEHNSSFQLGPVVAYQFQNKSERFFVRVEYTPKILAAAFDDANFGYGDEIVPFWFGLSIGGGW